MNARHARASALAVIALASAASRAQQAPVAGDAAAGGMAFLQCADCHSTTTANGAGPGLKNIVGRRAGSQGDFHYSDAMAKSNLVWDARTLDTFLANPKATVPGTSMDFPGVTDPAERANLIAYLATVK